MSPEEVKKLADTFSEKVFIRRNDSFLTSDPKEIEEFKKFLASREKYDVVIDALNIMFRVRNLPHKEKILNVGCQYVMQLIQSQITEVASVYQFHLYFGTI